MRHARPEAHVCDHIALGVEAGGDLDEFEPVRAHLENRALGHEQRLLATLAAHSRAVADLLELRHEFPVPALPTDDRAAVLPPDVDVACGQRSAEHDALRVLADVDEPADADDLLAEAAHVDIALR